jgi:dihydropteroate synthase
MAKVKLIGILNITPDSFSDGNPHLTMATILQRARQLISEGADILDIGAEATNPFVQPLSVDQEWTRLEPILAKLLSEFPGRISLDTYHAVTAQKALELGPVMLNDVTTFRDPAMIKLATKHRVRCIVSHLPFSAPTIADAHKEASMDTVEAVKRELLQRREEMIAADVKPENIILDPGIGFGKTMELNQKLLEFAKEVPGIPVLIGHSRKRFLGEHRFEIEPNLAAARKAISAGAEYLRVHDVSAHRQLLDSL